MEALLTQIRKVDPPPWLDPPVPDPQPGIPSLARGRVYAVGDAWYATPTPDGGWTMYADGPEDSRIPITPAKAHRDSGVRPIVVVLPNNGGPFCIHRSTSQGGPWAVTGDLENVGSLSVTPSIDLYHTAVDGGPRIDTIWHGHITNGRFV